MNNDPKRVNDGFAFLSGGVDFDKDPSLLEASQCASAGNISLRGDIPHTRPPFGSIPLGFENSQVQNNFTGRFQGACFYEANDETENSIITSVGGRLFRIYLEQRLSSGTGAWKYTGLLNQPRFLHTATLLNDGTVLVSGGGALGRYLNSCEIFNPTTGLWSTTGSLNTARFYHTATLLNDGTVLVAAGENSSGNSIKTCELYSPVTKTWSYVGSLNTDREYHTATLLENGKVLVTGGQQNPGNPLATCEIYDPVAKTWVATGSLAAARASHTATLLQDGTVLVAGGMHTIIPTVYTSACEVFNGTSWTNTGSLQTAREFHTATLLPNGDVLVAGGLGSGYIPIPTCEIFSGGSWTNTGLLNTARYLHTANLLPNGGVLVEGGTSSVFNPDGFSLSSSEFFNFSSGAWSITGSLNTARTSHTSVLLNNGTVLVSGGAGLYSRVLNSAELFTANIYPTTVVDITPNISELATQNFVVPAVGGSVTIYVTNEVEFTIGQALIIDSGSYTVTGILPNQLILTYNGGAANTNWLVVPNEIIYAANGTSQVIASNVPELVTATTNVPVIGTTVTVPVTYQSGTPFTFNQSLIIDGGSYVVFSTSPNSLVLTYLGGAAHTYIAVNTPITGAQVNGEVVGVGGFTVTGFPATGGSVSIPVTNKSDFTVGHYIVIDSGSYLITSVSANPIVATYMGGAADGTVIAGKLILSDVAITATIPEVVTSFFIVPALNQTVNIAVSSQAGFNVNNVIVIDGDNFTVTALPAGENVIAAEYTGGTAHVILNTSILDSSGNQIYHISPNPADADMVYLYQGENYIFGLCENQSTIIYDGSTAVLANQAEQQLQSSYVGTYAWGRNWLAQVNGHRFVASDLVGDPSGSPQLVYVDAILYMTENNLLNGGGAFSTPANLGQITAMTALSQLDSSLGIGPILVGTTSSIFSVQAPTDRTTWQNMTYPIQSIALQGSGPAGPRQMITVNSDAWFRSLDGVRSLMAARRDFKSSEGNTPNSQELAPIFNADDPSLLYYGSLASFDNRILATASPYRTNYGIAHRALTVINEDTVSSMQKKDPPVWESLWTGLNILQILTGNINGTIHCYTFALNANNGIDLWELLPEASDPTYDVVDQITNGVESLKQTPIQSWLDTKLMNFGDSFQMKKLIMGELYLDELVDNVNIKVYFRPDQYPLWTLWTTISICANVSQCTFPVSSGGSCLVWQTNFRQSGARIKLGRPSELPNNLTGQPMDRGYEFQFRIEITGRCQLRKFKASALMEQQAMEGGCAPAVVCKTLSGCLPAMFNYNSYGTVAAIGGESNPQIIGGEGGEIIGAEI